MTKEAALNAFFKSFGWAAYTDTSVPDSVQLPYITYQVITDSFDGGTVYPTVYLWAKGMDSELNTKARAIAERIGVTGVLLPCDGGYIRIVRGSPWCRNIQAEADKTIKGRYINIAIQYLTM